MILFLTDAQWADAGLHPVMLENIELCLYDGPTAIQMYSIPAVKMNKDLVAISQTGEFSRASFGCLQLTSIRVRQNRGFPHSNSVEIDG